jgi:fructose/tagatose bisphosphate aldolase
MKMRNKIIEATIDKVVDESNYPSDFKKAFKQFVKNKFDDNAKESDLKRILSLLNEDGEEITEYNMSLFDYTEMEDINQ